MVDFKKRLTRGSSLSNITEAIQKLQKKGYEEDTRIWAPTRDKVGNGFAIIRFLPHAPSDGEDGVPFVRQFSHSFEGPGGWLIDRCPTTLGQPCPVCDSNTELWETNQEAEQAIARKRKRKLEYVSNIYVVSDPAKPDNQGKVFLFKYGAKIFTKLQEKISPQFEGEKGMNPFDLWEGANFKLKVKKVEGYPNYDSSEFEFPTAFLNGDEDAINEIWNKEYSLQSLLDPKTIKSYDEIAERLAKVLKEGKLSQKASKSADSDSPKAKKPKATLPKEDEIPDELPPAPVDEDEDNALKDFQGLLD